MRHRPSLTVLVLALAALALAPETARAQTLRRASETVRSGESRSSESRSSDRDRGRDRDDDRSSLGRASSTVRSGGGGRGGGGGGEVSLGGRGRRGWWGPRRWHPTVVAYGATYAEPAGGYTSSWDEGPDVVLRSMVVPQLEGSYVSGDVGRFTASVRVLLPAPVELHGGYSVYLEPLPVGGVEALALGRLGVAWRVIDEDDVHLRLGGSLRHWQDYAGARFGGEVLAGLEMFPADPLVLGIEAAAGIVGDAWAIDVRATIGAMIDVVEIYAGWHHLALEALNGSGGVELTGPLVGVRLWI